jgi:Domain of unknown function (DUF2017)
VLRRSRRVKRTRKGIELGFADEERQLLKELVPQLRELLLADDNDETVRRLFPTAHPTDPKRNAEYDALVHDTLLEGRLATLEAFESTLDERILSPDQLGSWMGAINDLRLVLGTRLDVSEDDHTIDPDDPDAAARAIYQYLGFVLEEIVTVMSEALPAPPPSPAV